MLRSCLILENGAANRIFQIGSISIFKGGSIMKTVASFVILMLLAALPALAQEAGFVGVSIEDQRDGGPIVRHIEPNSPADRAGVKEGDVILEFDSSRVIGAQQLTRLVRETPVGRTVDLKIRRGTAEQTLKVTTERASNALLGNFHLNVPGVNVFADGFGNLTRNAPRFHITTTFVQSGIQVEQLTDQLRDFFAVRGNNGVLVTSVDGGSAAEKAGLKAGDVIIMIDGREIRDPGEFSREMMARPRPTLKIVRDRQERDLKME
jgi:serine protease Do